MKKPKIKVRRVWRINPRVRVKEGGKVYLRKKIKRETRKILEEGQDET